MRALFLIVLIVAAVVLGGWWLSGRMHGGNAYAPREAQDSELAAQPAPEPTPPGDPAAQRFQKRNLSDAADRPDPLRPTRQIPRPDAGRNRPERAAGKEEKRQGDLLLSAAMSALPQGGRT